jgi:hypothetical protein
MENDDKIGWYEVQDTAGNWHKCTAFQYSSYRCDGVPVRYQTKAMQLRQAFSESLERKQ